MHYVLDRPIPVNGSNVVHPEVFVILGRCSCCAWPFSDAQSLIGDALTAIKATNETWFEAEAHRVAGEIAFKFPQADAPKAQANWERALTVARQQQAKS